MRRFLLAFYNIVLAPLPLSMMKVMFLKAIGVRIGKGVSIGVFTHFYGKGNIEIGDNSFVGKNVAIEADGGCLSIGKFCEINYGSLLSANNGAKLSIEDHTHVAHFVSLKCSSHNIDLLGDSIAGESRFMDITIREGSWICAGAMVLPGVVIGSKTIVAAGAVVTQSSPDNSLLAGVPAMIKKSYSERMKP